MFGRVDRDAWFTPVDTATDLVRVLLEYYPQFREYDWFEPSAGNGAFIKGLINNKVELSRIKAMDLEPAITEFDIEQGDFFELSGVTLLENTVVIGNPPYGRKNSLTVKFIKQAFELGAEYVAFLLMGTSINSSYIKRVGYEIDNAFVFDAVQFNDSDGGVIGECGLTNALVVYKKAPLSVKFNKLGTIIDYTDIWGANYLSHYGVFKKLGEDFDRTRKVSNPNRPDRWYVEGYEKYLSNFLLVDEEVFDWELYKNLATLSFQCKALPETYNYWHSNKAKLTTLYGISNTKNRRRKIVREF